MKKYWQLILFLSIGVWIAAAIYGLIFNISYIDEAKYLIKGWLILTGQVSYYRTPEFFYQHMPGVFLWYGLGQKIFGPSLLAGRFQSLLIGLLVFGCSFLLGKRLAGKKGGVATIALLSLAPTVALYYSAAVPQSLVVLFLILGFIFLYDGLVKNNHKILLASICFSLTFTVRENFLFTLILYIGFLLIVFRNNFKIFLQHLVVIGLTLGIFIVPGYPGTIQVLKNFPGISYLLPVSLAEKQVLNLYWKAGAFSPELYLRAIKEFGVIFHAWILISGFIVYHWIKFGQKKLKFRKNPKSSYWQFLILVTGFNFIIHSWAAFKLSPRAIVSYFPYVAPLVAVIMASIITSWLKTNKQQKKALFIYLFLLLLAPKGIRFAGIFDIPTRQPDLRTTYQSAIKLKPIIKDKDKILWLGEPISLYLAGRVSYYPLINHTGFYKPSPDTETVKKLGFWNQEMLNQWLNESDLLTIEANKVKLLKENQVGKNLMEFVEKKVSTDFQLLEINDYIWPGGLTFYQPKQP